MARIYATPQQLADWLGLTTPPAGADRMLRSASRDVDEMLLTAIYDTDQNGLPTQPDHIEALQEATCAQVEYNQERGDPYGTGAQTYAEVQLGSARLVRTNQPPAGLPERHSHQAQQILQQAGLIPYPPWTC